MPVRSLRLQLLGWLLIPLAGVVVANTWVTYRDAQATASLVTDRTLLASARAMAEGVQVIDGRMQVVIPPVALEMFATEFRDRVYFRIARFEGAAETSLMAGNADLPRPGEAVLPLMSLVYDADYRGEPLRLVAIRQPVPGSDTATALVTVGETLGARDHMARVLWVRSLLQQALLGLIVAICVWFGLQRGLRPLLRLREEVLERRPEELRPFSGRGLQTELQPLVAALNQYSMRLREQIDAQQRFLANAAHQLRTPLTILATQAAYATRSADIGEKNEALAAIHGNARAMARLANQLLTLSRVEPGSEVDARQPVDLVMLARKALEAQVGHALEKNMDLGFDPAPEHAPMVGDPALLQEMIVNLVDNALRYTPSGGVVTVGIEPAEEAWRIGVRDNGPGIPEGERDRVFERFYRILGNEAEGSGLGLAIVRDIVDRHGGAIRLQPGADGRGLAVIVELPAGNVNG
jgi:two-component system sensor histidine kinase TctE